VIKRIRQPTTRRLLIVEISIGVIGNAPPIESGSLKSGASFAPDIAIPVGSIRCETLDGRLTVIETGEIRVCEIACQPAVEVARFGFR